MTYQQFKGAFTDATEFDSLDAYIAEVGGSIPEDITDDQLVPLLTRCYAYGRDRTPARIREITGLSRAEFARFYGVPYRTLENWERPDTTMGRQAPPYIVDLLAYAAITGAQDWD